MVLLRSNNNNNNHHHHNTAGLGTGELELKEKEVEEQIEKLLRNNKKHKKYNNNNNDPWNKFIPPLVKNFNRNSNNNNNNDFFDSIVTNQQQAFDARIIQPSTQTEIVIDPTLSSSLTSWQICVLCLLATSGILVVLFLHVVSIDQNKKNYSYLNKHNKSKIIGLKKHKKKNSSRNLIIYDSDDIISTSHNNNNQQVFRKKKNDDDDIIIIDNYDQNKQHHNPTVVTAYSRNTTTRIPTTCTTTDGNEPQQQHRQLKQQLSDRQMSGLTGLGQEEDPTLLTIDNNPHQQGYYNIQQQQHQQQAYVSDSSLTSCGSQHQQQQVRYKSRSKMHRPFMDSPRLHNTISPIGIPTYLKSSGSISSSHSSINSGNNTNMEGMVVRFPSPPSSFSSASTIESITSSTKGSNSVIREQRKSSILNAMSPKPPPFSQTGLRQRRYANTPESNNKNSKIIWNNSTEIDNTPIATNKDNNQIQFNNSLQQQQQLPYLPNLKENKNNNIVIKPPPQTMEEIQKYSKSLSKSQDLILPTDDTDNNNNSNDDNNNSNNDDDNASSFSQDWNLKLPPSPNSTTSIKSSASARSRASIEVAKRLISSISPSIKSNAISSSTTTTTNPITNISFDELKFQEIIGTGGFGQVYQAIWRGTPVAVKVLSSITNPNTITNNNTSQEEENHNKQLLQEFAAEIQMLSSIRHPNICLYIGACVKPPNRAIITELCINGSLWDALRKPLFTPLYTEVTKHSVLSIVWPNLPTTSTTSTLSSDGGASQQSQQPPVGAWPWSLIKKVAEGAARGLTYLHSSTPIVLHRDLKSANLLLDESYNVKVADFGLSRFKATRSSKGSSCSSAVMTGNCGTVQWMAPEVLSNQKYAEPADVYSYGIILWELLCKQCPYDGMNAIQCALAVLNKGYRPEIPTWCPIEFKNLIEKCIAHNPNDRPTFEQILISLGSMTS